MDNQLRRLRWIAASVVCFALVLLVGAVVTAIRPTTGGPISDRPSPSLRESPRPNQREAQDDTKYDAAHPQGSSSNPVVIKVLPEEKSEPQSRKEEYESNEKPGLDRGLTAYTLWLAGFTLVLSVAASIQVALFWWQLRLIRDSLIDSKEAANAAKISADVARNGLIASNRAWLSTSIDLGDQPFVFSEFGMSASVAVSAVNIGKEPAIAVSPHVWLFVWRPGYGLDPLRDLNRRCDEVRSRPSTEGYILLPGEAFPAIIGCGGYQIGVKLEPEEIEDGLRGGTTDAKSRPCLSIFVGGCFDYCTPSDPGRRHQTRFYFGVVTHNDSIRPERGTIPRTELSLSSNRSGQILSID